jgi:hypothetical protein
VHPGKDYRRWLAAYNTAVELKGSLIGRRVQHRSGAIGVVKDVSVGGLWVKFDISDRKQLVHPDDLEFI